MGIQGQHPVNCTASPQKNQRDKEGTHTHMKRGDRHTRTTSHQLRSITTGRNREKMRGHTHVEGRQTYKGILTTVQCHHRKSQRDKEWRHTHTKEEGRETYKANIPSAAQGQHRNRQRGGTHTTYEMGSETYTDNILSTTQGQHRKR